MVVVSTTVDVVVSIGIVMVEETRGAGGRLVSGDALLCWTRGLCWGIRAADAKSASMARPPLSFVIRMKHCSSFRNLQVVKLNSLLSGNNPHQTALSWHRLALRTVDIAVPHGGLDLLNQFAARCAGALFRLILEQVHACRVPCTCCFNGAGIVTRHCVY